MGRRQRNRPQEGTTYVSDSSTSMHPFDRAMRLQAIGEGVFAGHTSDDYWNFTGPFGGTTAATLLNAAMLHP
jgi:hypothetical protein